jgi:nicotinamide-nucleotide amidase
MMQRAAILSTGDELTTGRIVDTNASWLADRLNQIGLDLVTVITVGDYPERLEWAWRTAMEMADVVISTGGLGPTADDLTTETVARLAGQRLVRDEATVEHIRHIFTASGRQMPENNVRQALFPEDAVIIPNPIGTAPGFRLAVPQKAHVCHLIVLPGVPREMILMMQETVMPWLSESRGHDEVLVNRTFQTYGISESGLDALVAGVISPHEARVGFRASFPQISLRLAVRGKPGEAERKLEELSSRVRDKVGAYIYAEGDVTMEEMVGKLLTEHNLTLAVAESCTGGLIGHRLTNIPGSSRYLLADVVSYSNEAKIKLLGVSEETLRSHGAVSEQCVTEMAAGARKLAGADIAIATSGIAGPDGGTAEKPVGTVCFALNAPGVSIARTHRMRGARDWVKLGASQLALDWIRRHVLGLPLSEPARR